jgi:hypothetical protein
MYSRREKEREKIITSQLKLILYIKYIFISSILLRCSIWRLI